MKQWVRFIGVLMAVAMVIVGWARPAAASYSEAVLRAGDQVKVTCEEEPSLNKDYIITNDGLIVMSFIGAVPVAGATEAEAADRIENELVKQRIVRRATVTVKLVTSKTQPVRFSGAVKNPGEMPWREGLRLSDIAKVAEPNTAADLEKVRIEPRVGDAYTVNFKAFDGKDMKFNPVIKAGDFVFFPLGTKSSEVFVLGGVNKPGAYSVAQAKTVASAIQIAGGISTQGNPAKIRLERPGSPMRQLTLSRDGAVALMSGDRVVVELVAPNQIVIITGSVKTPGTVGWYDGLTLVQAINACGGIQEGYKPGRIKVIRRKANGTGTETKSVDLKKILDGFAGDFPLLPGDQVQLPQIGKRGGADLTPLIGILIFILIRP